MRGQQLEMTSLRIAPADRPGFAPAEPDYREVPGMVALTGVDPWYMLEIVAGRACTAWVGTHDGEFGWQVRCEAHDAEGDYAMSRRQDLLTRLRRQRDAALQPAQVVLRLRLADADAKLWVHDAWDHVERKRLSFERLKALCIAMGLPLAVISVGRDALDNATLQEIARSQHGSHRPYQGVVVRSQQPGWGFRVGIAAARDDPQSGPLR